MIQNKSSASGSWRVREAILATRLAPPKAVFSESD